MADMQAHTDTDITAPQASGKTIFRKIAKGILWIAGIWTVLLLILQLALSPAVLKKITDRFAAGHIDGNLKFEKVRVNMFRHFPYAGIEIENGSLTYPAERFDSLESKAAQGLLLYHGCGEKEDTLASFRRFSAGIDALSLLAGKIHISHVTISKPRIFAHSYDDGNANWNMFRIEESEDTSEFVMPHIGIGRIRLTEHPHIVYTDSRDTLFSIIDVKNIAFDGKLDSRRSHKNKIGISFDSMKVAGRIAADTIGLSMDRLHIHEHNDHMDIHAEAKALLATRAFGRMHVPVKISGTAAFHDGDIPSMEMNGFKGEIAAIPIDFDLALKKGGSGIGIDGRFNINECKVEGIIDDFVKNIIPEAQKIRTDASISLSGTCSGIIGNGELPSINAMLTVPASTVSHKELEHDVMLALKARVKTDEDGRINVSIDETELKTYGLQLSAIAGVSDILGDDPLISLDGNFRASADSLLTFMPEDSGITANGQLTASLKGEISMSQMDIYNFGQADLTGKIASDGLIIKSPKDTIDISFEDIAIQMGPETKVSKQDSGAVFRLLGISGYIEKADISLKETISLSSRQLSFSAKNSVDAISSKGTTKVHPLGGRIMATELYIEDGEGMSVTFDNTSNGFQMVPKKSNSAIPVLSLSSENKRIYLRDKSNRIILTDANIKAGAAMNSVERRQRRKAVMDSLASAHPEIPKDSLMAHLRSQRRSKVIPDWMKEEDFKSGDLNFSLDGMVADYFRKWDMNGDIDVRTGILMTPKLPLRNIIKSLDISFNNNEIKIDDFKIRSGESDISMKGSLSGLRRALLGRGTYKLYAELFTSKMDAAEMFAALNAGAASDLGDTEQMAGASDSEFLKMVVADSLETEPADVLLIVPSDINAEIKVNAFNVSFSDLLINRFTADVMMKERCMQIVNSDAVTNMGKAHFDGFYATRSKKEINTGFNFSMTDVTSEKVISMMPAIDTIMPLLKSFKGQIDCELAATADLDTCMNIITPSINGVIRIEGEDLTMGDNEVFSNLAKKLKFKNSKEAKIDRMTVEGLIKDNMIEVFPFILDLDRYTLALSGLQNLDMSYRYHASILRSPMVFKVGVDIYGPDFDNMKFKIGKPKYRNTEVPVFTAVIDETRMNLAESIRNIFEKGVEIAVMENERQHAIEEHKRQIGYINAAEQSIEELTEEEQRQLDEESRKAEAPAQIDSTTIANTLKAITGNEQPGIY